MRERKRDRGRERKVERKREEGREESGGGEGSKRQDKTYIYGKESCIQQRMSDHNSIIVRHRPMHAPIGCLMGTYILNNGFPIIWR